jgi:hypothetical protein
MDDNEVTSSSTEVKIYECIDCNRRTEADHHPEVCPACGGELVDISVPRE